MDIGSTIRSIRKRKKITIAEMSCGTGLSKGFISNMENNNTSPSISTLETVANFLNVPLTYLLLKKEDRIQVVRQDERTLTISQQGKMKVETVSSRGGLRIMHVELEPGASSGVEPHAHQGEECHVVLKGTILAEQGEESIILNEGDSFSWNASVPHIVKNIGEDPAVVLIAVYSTN
ncbi:helix-turn-helix domain-containing protein [Sutcliffiella cohnii]|uniref:DNA-binding protein n=1 Tax=Sutcliffiella cohnii TaxID=33932 RepID=A0A223KPH6_9BACI|nr:MULTISPECIES: cupin domain-containing protein [Sutcliffiella]AST91359.1 DNA-binding protein [Sutcliffiella cohnii]WBL17190.1 cupin domain-containing protein [Sutcliffiella sp. NC1]